MFTPTSTRLRRLLLRPCCALGLLLAAQTTWAVSYEVELTEQELQQRVTEMLPIKKEKMFVSVELREAKIDLLDDSDQIGVFSKIEINAPGGIHSAGTAKVKGSLRYLPQVGEFYFKDPEVQELNFDKIPDAMAPKLREMVTLVARTIFDSTPVYKFKQEDIKVKALLKSVSIKNNKIFLLFSAL